MIAFVLSGGGSRGALQVGALKALLKAGIKPDIVIGSSVGAINATGLAVDPSITGGQRLITFWRNVETTRIYDPNLITIAMRMLMRRDSLVSNDQFHCFVRRHVLAQARTFEDIQGAQLYITAVDLQTGRLVIFGDERQMNLVDAIMASTSIQLFFAPWEIQGRRYIDGGYLSNLPILTALERRADEVFALDLTALKIKENWLRGVIPILLHEADIVLYHLAQFEIEQARQTLGDRLHHIAMTDYDGHSLFDFSKTEAMIHRGEAIMRAYLSSKRSERVVRGAYYARESIVRQRQEQNRVETLSR